LPDGPLILKRANPPGPSKTGLRLRQRPKVLTHPLTQSTETFGTHRKLPFTRRSPTPQTLAGCLTARSTIASSGDDIDSSCGLHGQVARVSGLADTTSNRLVSAVSRRRETAIMHCSAFHRLPRPRGWSQSRGLTTFFRGWNAFPLARMAEESSRRRATRNRRLKSAPAERFGGPTEPLRLPRDPQSHWVDLRAVQLREMPGSVTSLTAGR
jgi:hypothetical protein